MKQSVEFELKVEHITLLRSMLWEYQDDYEPGAPGVDQKRPYGSNSVAEDVCDLLIWNIPDYDNERDYDDAVSKAMKLHYETRTAVTVIMDTMQFEPGRYRWTSRNGWVLIKGGQATQVWG